MYSAQRLVYSLFWLDSRGLFRFKLVCLGKEVRPDVATAAVSDEYVFVRTCVCARAVYLRASVRACLALIISDAQICGIQSLFCLILQKCK